MTTLTATRPAYRPYRAVVSEVRRMSPHFTRVSFRCDDFEHFGTEGLDQRIKLLFPLADGTFSELGFDDDESVLAGDWYERWRALPEERRNPFRTYTVRTADPDDRRVDIDFVAHGDGGPAARWLFAATPGDPLVIIGPDARSEHRGVGIDWHPGECTELLLVGDETAVPAISAILETRPADCRAHVFLEVPSGDDALPLRAPAGVTVTWLAPTPTVTATFTATATATATATVTASPAPSTTSTATDTPAPTIPPTPTDTPVPSATPSVTVSPTPTSTSSPTSIGRRFGRTTAAELGQWYSLAMASMALGIIRELSLALIMIAAPWPVSA